MEKSLTIVTWKWHGEHPKKKNGFAPEHVNCMYSMLQRHLHMPFQMVCLTDDPTGIRSEVECLPLWKDYCDAGGCFRRLKIFSSDIGSLVGRRFASIDLDAVIVDDVTPIFDRDEEFIIWCEHFRETPYCGSLFMMDAGCRPQVWENFNIHKYPPNHRGRWPRGTDQDHICRCLYPEEATWSAKDGIYNFNHSIRKWPQFKKNVRLRPSRYKRGRYLKRFQILHGLKVEPHIVPEQFRFPKSKANGELPKGARIVFFNGKHDPSDEEIQQEYPWVREHWK